MLFQLLFIHEKHNSRKIKIAALTWNLVDVNLITGTGINQVTTGGLQGCFDVSHEASLLDRPFGNFRNGAVNELF